ncbi:MAG: dimethylsulfonioproprionate lyase family protein [Candidatus Aminicenantaceae bacterium]|jgi:mannose-6-phosphate isomerase-like protein (cupin superfamily)
MKKVVFEDLAEKIPKKFAPIRVAKVENCGVSLALIDGDYPFHRHNGDEFFIVFKGGVTIDIHGGESISLKEGEGLLVEEGTVHRSRSQEKSFILVFEAVDLVYTMEEK